MQTPVRTVYILTWESVVHTLARRKLGTRAHPTTDIFRRTIFFGERELKELVSDFLFSFSCDSCGSPFVCRHKSYDDGKRLQPSRHAHDIQQFCIVCQFICTVFMISWLKSLRNHKSLDLTGVLESAKSELS